MNYHIFKINSYNQLRVWNHQLSKFPCYISV